MQFAIITKLGRRFGSAIPINPTNIPLMQKFEHKSKIFYSLDITRIILNRQNLKFTKFTPVPTRQNLEECMICDIYVDVYVCLSVTRLLIIKKRVLILAVYIICMLCKLVHLFPRTFRNHLTVLNK